MVQVEIHRCRVVPLVVQHDAAVAGDPADLRHRHLLPGTKRLEKCGVLVPQQQRILLLVFGNPDFEDRQRFVADRDLPDLDSGARGTDDFLEHVAVSAGSLIMDADDRVAVAELHASTDDPVDLLLHLRVASLDGIEIEFGDVFPLDHARGGPSAETDAVRGSADFDDPHPGLRAPPWRRCWASIWPMPPENMIGLIHSRRSPSGRRSPRARVYPRITGSPNLLP